LLALNCKESVQATSEHLSNIVCKPDTDGLSRIMSSEYSRHPKNNVKT